MSIEQTNQYSYKSSRYQQQGLGRGERAGNGLTDYSTETMNKVV